MTFVKNNSNNNFFTVIIDKTPVKKCNKQLLARLNYIFDPSKYYIKTANNYNNFQKF